MEDDTVFDAPHNVRTPLYFVSQVTLDRQDPLDVQELRVPAEHMVILVPVAPAVGLEPQAQMAMMVALEPQVHQVPLDPRVIAALMAWMAAQDAPVRK